MNLFDLRHCSDSILQKASGVVDRAQAFTPCARLSADNQFRQFRGQAFKIVETTIAVVMIAAITVFDAIQAGLQAFPVAHPADTEIRQDFIDNHNLFASMPNSQNQIVIVIEPFA